jgi:NAD-dependent deacetylase
MKNVVVLTGAGISAESGLKTFRDSGGLWENYRVEDVATPMAWHKDPGLVLEFYNQRRKQVLESKPNKAHAALVELESGYNVHIITQNIDDLHERAGSSNVLHLHGEIRKSRSTLNPQLVYDIDGPDLKEGEKCEKGSQLRPHIVWFGEEVPMLDKAALITRKADVLIVIGTSLAVYPAAGLIYEAENATQKYLIDPQAVLPDGVYDFKVIREPATSGVPAIVGALLNTNHKH